MMDAATLKHIRYVATDNPVTLGAFVLFSGFVFLALFGPWRNDCGNRGWRSGSWS